MCPCSHPLTNGTQQSALTVICCKGTHLSLNTKPQGNGYTHLYTGPRVILCVQTNRVSKYYDAAFHDFLNIAVNKRYIPGASIQQLNHHVTVLQYTYLSGSHVLQSPQQVAALLGKLQNLHQEGLVHSDMRLENLIFCTDAVSAHLIDFDLTALEGDCYPVEYVTQGIEERHSNAQCGAVRKKIHDRYSLHYVLTKRLLFKPSRRAVDMLLDESTALTTIVQKLTEEGGL